MTAVPESSTQLTVASIGAAASGLGFIGIGIASIAQQHAGFSLGIGVVLIIYGLLCCLAAWAGWRGSLFATGAIIASGLINIATVLSYMDGPGWYWAALVAVVPAITVVAAAWHRVLRNR